MGQADGAAVRNRRAVDDRLKLESFSPFEEWLESRPYHRDPDLVFEQWAPADLSISELGLMTGAADPMLNMSEHAATVTPELWWMAGGSPQSATLPQMTILPHQTMNLNAPGLLAAAGLKNFNGSVNLILGTKAQPGGLVMSSGSLDQTNTYVFEVIPHGVAEGVAKALCNWSTGNGDDTMVT